MVNSKQKLRYGLHEATGRVIHVSEALRGSSCNCNCVVCGDSLEAAQGTKNTWYFRHSNPNCSGAPETALHQLAKQIICENTCITIDNKEFHYTDACQEKMLESIIPDVSVTCGEYRIHFEIRVTHAIGADKESFYNKRQLKSIEIDLCGVAYDTKPDRIKELVLKETSNKRKIFWEVVPQKLPKANTGNDLLRLLGVMAFLIGLLSLFSSRGTRRR